jgi:hypothetical protein
MSDHLPIRRVGDPDVAIFEKVAQPVPVEFRIVGFDVGKFPSRRLLSIGYFLEIDAAHNFLSFTKRMGGALALESGKRVADPPPLGFLGLRFEAKVRCPSQGTTGQVATGPWKFARLESSCATPAKARI